MPLQSMLQQAVTKIQDWVATLNLENPDDLKRGHHYLDWLAKKTGHIQDEQNHGIPENVIPQVIPAAQFNWLPPALQAALSLYYTQDTNDPSIYKLSLPTLTQSQILYLAKTLLLTRGNVVWIDFGFNIGEEFGGKHPALILKGISEVLVVIPLSTQLPDDLADLEDFEVYVDKVHKLPPRGRLANVFRIVTVSVRRVDWASGIGYVKGTILDDITKAMKKVRLISNR